MKFLVSAALSAQVKAALSAQVSAAAILLSIVMIFSGCAGPHDPSLKALWNNQKASSFVEKKQSEEARGLFYKILETDPDLPAMHSNLGVLYLQEEKFEESEKSLQHALKLAREYKDFAAEYVIEYNLGVLFGLQKKVEPALEHYQAALEIDAASKIVKHNIELLIQNGSGGESGDKKDKKDQSGDQNSEDQKDGKGQDEKDKESKDDKKDQKDQEKKDDDKKDGKDKNYGQNPKYQPRPFKGEELSEGDVKKILGELKNQEQRIRANFEKKERKDKKNDKDW